MGPALYGDIENTDVNKKITCPDVVSSICEELTGNLTWRKVGPSMVLLAVNNKDVFSHSEQ